MKVLNICEKNNIKSKFIYYTVSICMYKTICPPKTGMKQELTWIPFWFIGLILIVYFMSFIYKLNSKYLSYYELLKTL